LLTRIEIDGFKSFENFSLDLQPFTAIVGPNASGKSNLFDALRLISLLAHSDIRTAMQSLRGRPEELFRKTASGSAQHIIFAVETFLPSTGVDPFGTHFEVRAQRLRYEVALKAVMHDGLIRAVSLDFESCYPLAKKNETSAYLKALPISYNANVSPFIRLTESAEALEVRQDGRHRHGKPVKLPLASASRTALSTISTAEFPHLYALKDELSRVRFLEIEPRAARLTNDVFDEKTLRSDASNLAATLAHLKEATASTDRPSGVLSDIAADLGSLIPSVKSVEVTDDQLDRKYAFSVNYHDKLSFSSRVISDGTLRLLALLTVLNDPARQGVLCFEEPENGVHEGRIPYLIDILRSTACIDAQYLEHPFQVLMNTHSPKVMSCLLDHEIVAADNVYEVDPKKNMKTGRTRMRRGVVDAGDMFDPERNLTRAEVEKLLQTTSDAA